MEKDIYSFARKYGITENKVIDASSGICPIGPSRKVKAAIRKSVKRINSYADPRLLRLRKLFASKFGIADDTLLFANSLAGFLHLTTDVLRPCKILLAGPAPYIYTEAGRSSGSEIVIAEADEESGFDITAGALKKKLDDADMVFLSNPNQITGRMIGRDELSSIIGSAAAANIPVVLDESLADFVQDGSCSVTAPDSDNVIAVRTTAHFYGLPGLELAYAVSSPEMIARLSEKNHCQVNTLSAEAARTALKDESYKRLARQYVCDEMRYLTRSLIKLPGIKLYPSDSNVLLIKLRDRKENMIRRLAGEGFFIREFKDPAGTGDLFLRIAVMAHDKNVKFVRILAGKDAPGTKRE